MAEYSRMAKGHFTSTGNAQFVNLPFQPDRVNFINYTLANTNATSQNIISASWDVSMGQGQAVIQGYNATPTLIYDVVATNGISTFAAGQMLQYGPLTLLGVSGGAGIALTSSTVLTVTTAAAHGLTPGQWVIFQNLYQTATTGMQQIAGIPFQVQSANFTTTAFQVAWNGTGTGLTAITTTATGLNGNLPGFKQILYPTLYEPGVAYPYAITVTAGVGTVTTTAPHNFKLGQEIAFRLPAVYGAQNLNSLPDVLIPGSPQYYYVSGITNLTTFTFANAPVLSTAFNLNQTFASFPGLSFAQVVAVGDVNTGGELYNGGNLYPSPLLYTSLAQAPTINGPAILGSYVNNTSQGFVIGVGAGRVLTTGVLVGANTNVIYWQAFLDDLQVN
jgi:hypothetical protein